MTSEEFWKDNPKLLYSYYKAYENKQKRELELNNYNNWLQGLYVYDGLEKSLTDFGYGFLAGKKNPNRGLYPSEPYNITGNKEEEKLRKKEIERNKNQDNLNFWATIKK